MINVIMFLALSVVIIACGLALYFIVCILEYTQEEERKAAKWRHFMAITDLSQW